MFFAPVSRWSNSIATYQKYQLFREQLCNADLLSTLSWLEGLAHVHLKKKKKGTLGEMLFYAF